MDLSQMISRSYTHTLTPNICVMPPSLDWIPVCVVHLLCQLTIFDVETGQSTLSWLKICMVGLTYGNCFFGWQLPMLRRIKFKTLFHVSTHCSVNGGRWWFPVRWKSSLGTLWHDKRHGVMGRCVFEENPHMFCVLISSMYIYIYMYGISTYIYHV